MDEQGTGMRLRDKVAVVTGAAQGIGLACARRFAEEGAKVVIGDIAGDKGEAAAKALHADGFEARFVEGDVGTRAAASRLVEEAVSAFGRIYVLVNNV
jgi:NAD(P)-dependent dehydrogenase (short-subunit alcohol dehydrogenase family)